MLLLRIEVAVFKTVVVVVVVAPAAAYVSDFEPHSRCRDRIFIPEISKNSIRYDIVVIKLLFPKFPKNSADITTSQVGMVNTPTGTCRKRDIQRDASIHI